MKEEFKNFVRKKPELIKYVNNGSMTWQKFYEQWNLYGEDDKYWSEYTTKENTNNKESKKEENHMCCLNIGGPFSCSCVIR